VKRRGGKRGRGRDQKERRRLLPSKVADLDGRRLVGEKKKGEGKKKGYTGRVGSRAKGATVRSVLSGKVVVARVDPPEANRRVE